MRKRLLDVDIVGQVIGFFVVLVGLGLALAGFNLGSDFARQAAAVTRTGIQMTIVGGMIIIIAALYPSFRDHQYGRAWWRSLVAWFRSLKRDHWQRFLCEDYAGRDIQMYQDSSFYRGRIDRIELFLPTRRRSSKIVCIMCNKGHFVRDDNESDWRWVKLPMQVVIDYERLNPIFEPDGRVIFRGRFAGQDMMDQAVILDCSNILPVPQKHDAETSGDDIGA